MAHEHVYGFCDAKCKVEVDTKANTDVVKNKVSTLESNVSTLSSSVGGFDSRIKALENEANGAMNCTSVTTSGKITANGGIAGTTGTFSGKVTVNKLDQSAVHTVTSGTPSGAFYSGSIDYPALWFVLPNTITNYTGSIKIKGVNTVYAWYRLGTDSAPQDMYIASGDTFTISFTNVDSVYIWVKKGYERVCNIASVTLS